jgi:hypothetical protein
MGNTVENDVRVGLRSSRRAQDPLTKTAVRRLEVPSHCAHSVLEKRHVLSGELGGWIPSPSLRPTLRAMRAACRKFLERVGTDGREVILYTNHHRHSASWTFVVDLSRNFSGYGKPRSPSEPFVFWR